MSQSTRANRAAARNQAAPVIVMPDKPEDKPVTQGNLEKVVGQAVRDSLRLELVEALRDDGYLKLLKDAVKDEWLHQQIVAMKQDLDAVKAENVLLKARLSAVEKKSEDNRLDVDKVEQQGRKDSLRLFGVPEGHTTATGETDAESLAYEVFTTVMGVPIQREEIEVSHHIGRPPTQQQIVEARVAGRTVKPRAIIVKFRDRKSKAKVMDRDAKKKLKDTQYFIVDDLTQARARLAFLARVCKRDGLGGVKSTFVANSKVFIQDAEGVIKEIKSERDLPPMPPELLQRRQPRAAPQGD